MKNNKTSLIVSNIVEAIRKAIEIDFSIESVEPHEKQFVEKIRNYLSDPNHRFGVKGLDDGQLILWWLSEAELIIACPIKEDMFLFSQLGFLVGNNFKRLGEKIETDSEKDVIISNEAMRWKHLLNEYDPNLEIYQYFR